MLCFADRNSNNSDSLRADDLSSSKGQELDRMQTVRRMAPLPLRWSTNPKGLGNLLHLCPVHILITDAIFFVHVNLSVCCWTKLIYYTPTSKRILKYEQEHQSIHQALKTHKHTSELKTWDMLRTCHILTNIPCVLCGYATSKSPILTCKRTST